MDRIEMTMGRTMTVRIARGKFEVRVTDSTGETLSLVSDVSEERAMELAAQEAA